MQSGLKTIKKDKNAQYFTEIEITNEKIPLLAVGLEYADQKEYLREKLEVQRLGITTRWYDIGMV